MQEVVLRTGVPTIAWQHIQLHGLARTCGEIKRFGSSSGLSIKGVTRGHPSAGVGNVHPQAMLARRQKLHRQAIIHITGAGIVDGDNLHVGQVLPPLSISLRRWSADQGGCLILHRGTKPLQISSGHKHPRQFTKWEGEGFTLLQQVNQPSNA